MINDDDLFDDDSEDKEIMKSIAYAEAKLNTKMGTPVAMKEHSWSPTTYDVENFSSKIDS